MNDSLFRILRDPIQPQPVQSQQPSLPCSWIRQWRSFLSSALLLLLICGSASAQLVKVVGWQNGVPNLAANVMTVTGMDLDDSTTVLVVGMYGDNSPVENGFTAVTFGGVPPTGLINNAANVRSALAYWINPNTAAGQTLSFTYTTPFAGYYWAYQLSNVDTNAPVATSGAQVLFGTNTSLTLLTNNSFVVSYIAGNNNNAADANIAPNPPLIKTGPTIGNAPAGASMASATNTIPTPGLQNIVWVLPPGNNLAQYGVSAVAFQPLNVGAPIVGGSVSPSVSAPGSDFILTVTIDPFHYGNVTNVSVDLSSIGGPSANALVQSSNPNVWTNSFTVPGGAPIGTTNLIVTAKQDAAPITGSAGSVAINIAAASAPALVKDTNPTNSFSVYAGQGVTLSASFSAPGFITYRWQKSPDGVTFTNIPGAANTSYTISSAALSDAGFYRLQASNFLGSAVSTPSQIIVNNASTAIYLWSAPIPFAGLTAEQILTNFPAANKIAGAMVAQSGGNPISVVLTNAGNRLVMFAKDGNWASLSGGAAYILNINTNKTGNTTFDSVLNSAYNNNATNTITLTLGGLVVGQKYQVQLFALDDRAGLTPDGSLQFSYFLDPLDAFGVTSQPFAMADNVYVLGTFTASSNTMTIQQNLVSSSGNLNCLVLRTVGWDPPPYFTVQPKSTNFFAGSAVSFTGNAAADTTIASPTITYQWASGPAGGPYVNLTEGSKYGGVTNTSLTISNLAAGDANSVYVLKASNGGGTTISREARVFVQSQPPTPPANSFAGAVLALTTNRLVGLWQLNEVEDPSTGILFAQDASGKGHHGTYGITSRNKFNGVLSPQPPTFGGFASGQGALQTGAAGTGDATSVVNLPPLNITNGVDTTICMWIKPTAVAPNLGGLLYNRGPDQCGFGFAGNAGGPSNQRNLGFVWNNANGEATYNYNSGLFPVNDIWNFVVLVIRTNAATFYLDYVDTNGAAFFGKAADTASRYTQNFWTGGPIWIGGDPSAGGTTIFPGSIANVAAFNTALTDDQIYNLFVAGFQTAGFPASILQQPPAAITNYAGFALQISTVNGGSQPIASQWKFNGTNLVDGLKNGSLIIGSTSNVLTIYNVSTNYSGVYNLAVTNFLGGAVSSNAVVTILTPEAPPAGNLVGRWFGGASNLTDISGHLPGVHNGTQILSNGVPRGILTWSSDLPPNATPGGSSLVLTNTGVLINNSSTADAGYQSTFDALGSAMTVSFWARGWPGTWNPFVSKYGETTAPAGGWQVRNDGGNNLSPCWTIRGNPGTVVLGTAVGGNAEDMAATSLTYGNDNQWHFYCATYDLAAGQRVLYVDGSLVAYTTGQGPYTLAPDAHLAIGARDAPPGTTTVSNYTAAYFTGKLYDVRIYDVALTGAQQASLAAPPPLPVLQAPALTATVDPGGLKISWGNDAAGYVLESSGSLGTGASWTIVPSTPNPIAGSGSTTVSTTGNPQFYRLRK